MIPTLISILIYSTFIIFLVTQTLKLKSYLVRMNALSEDTAVSVDSTKYFILTTNFPFSAIRQTGAGTYWYDDSRWRTMTLLFFAVVSISGFSFLILILSYI